MTQRGDLFLKSLLDGGIPRVPGTAVFLTRNLRPVPGVMVRHVREMGALQAELVSLTVRFEQQPRVPLNERVEVEQVFEGFWHITARWGFMDNPDLSAAVGCAREHGCTVDFDHAVFFASRDDVVASRDQQLMPHWRRVLFAFLYRNGARTVDRFNLPAERFVEVGRQIAL